MWAVGWLVACSAPEPVLWAAADPARAGLGGEDGPYGALVHAYSVPVRVRDARAAEIVVPVDADGATAVRDAPAVLFTHGGFVEKERYTWIGAHLATRGYVVVQAEHNFDLALFEWGNGLAALRFAAQQTSAPWAGALAADGPLVVGGHSLGGVVAARQWLDPEVEGLFLLASLAAPGDPVEAASPRPVLSLVGSADARIGPEEVADGAARFPGEPWVGVVDGLNHYGFTDEATEAELASDGEATRPVAAARRDALAVLDAWLDAVLIDGVSTFDGVFPNVERVTE